MTVDLSKARAGDTVKFRNSGILGIAAICDNQSGGYYIRFNDDVTPVGFDNDGKCQDLAYIMDIISVIPAPVAFDWSTAKAGMAFRFEGQVMVYHYIGNSIDKERGAVFQGKEGRLMFFRKEHLTRAPEHDVEGV